MTVLSVLTTLVVLPAQLVDVVVTVRVAQSVASAVSHASSGKLPLLGLKV